MGIFLCLSGHTGNGTIKYRICKITIIKMFLLFNNNKNEQYLLNPSNDFKKEIMIFSIFFGEENF
jgi:hypothetical protein